MNNTKFDAVLDALTPNHILTPITQEQQGFQRIIYLEEELENLVEVDPFFSDGPSSENEVNKNDNDSMVDQDDSNVNETQEEKTLFHRRFNRGIRHFNKIDNMVDISKLCYWKASSSKVMHPIENVLNDDPESFWQSDGGQPHIVDIYFNKRVELAMLVLFFGFEVDESYSPSVMKIYIGDSINDLIYYEEWRIQRITQWFAKKFPSYPQKRKNHTDEDIDLYDERRPERHYEERYRRNDSNKNTKHEKEMTLPVKCQVMRLTFPLNHDNGKDTHLRGIRIFAKDDGALPVVSSNTETQIGSTDRVLANMYPKSKFNDGLYSIR